jgi:hypothetical protein
MARLLTVGARNLVPALKQFPQRLRDAEVQRASGPRTEFSLGTLARSVLERSSHARDSAVYTTDTNGPQ